MDLNPLFRRYPELKELFIMLQQQIQSLQRPANEVVMTDQAVMKMLEISERKLDYMKARKVIPFSQPIKRSSCYWLLSDILEWLKKSRNESLDNDCRI
jgi:predicted DNA-binding transcriptional regulator AlpA